MVVGSGPNGLAAAIRLAQEGRSVLVVEAAPEAGGGARTAERTLPGYRHDICSAVHPMGVASPFFRTLPLTEHGLRWVHPEVPLAHPLDGGGGCAAMLRGLDATAELLGVRDGRAYRRTFAPLVERGEALFAKLLGPLRPPPPALLPTFVRFGLDAARPATWLARMRFRGEAARALFAGHAAHSIMPLESPFTSAIGLMLNLAGHTGGWPVAEGGSGALTAALVAHLRSLGGELICGWRVEHLSELPAADHYLFDTTPGALASICRDRLPARYLRKLRRFRHGPGVFKIDWALRGPIPWKAELARKAGTVHVGGTLAEIAASERIGCATKPSNTAIERPFVLLAQPTVCDPARAPAGGQIAWGYCHVPPGDPRDHTAAIEAQVERFAPGFLDLVEARATMSPADYQAHNANLVGGDVAGGLNSWRQLFARPVASPTPYRTPAPDIFLCSSSTPPGGGVHGMCGFHAAELAARQGSSSKCPSSK